VGGSASTDGGTGMARALGYRFLDSMGRELPEGGGYLRALHRIDTSGFDPVWHATPITIACDVDNPLLGPSGAARVYAPQKGASPEDVEVLEAGLERLAEIAERDLGVDFNGPRAGAAGGLAGGLRGCLAAELRPGADLVLETLGFEGALSGARVMITGEGRLDRQSLSGKAPVAAGRASRRAGVVSVALVGSVGDGYEAALGDAFDQVVPIAPAGLPPATAIAMTAELLEAAAGRLAADL
jgi:glycerate kinase